MARGIECTWDMAETLDNVCDPISEKHFSQAISVQLESKVAGKEVVRWPVYCPRVFHSLRTRAGLGSSDFFRELVGSMHKGTPTLAARVGWFVC